jgi:RNA polymerase-binding transcription factor DksA
VTDESPDPTTTPADPDAPHTAAAGDAPEPPVDSPELDLDAVERDLAAVETALQRLSEGTYWTDEVTGEPIPEHVLAADPTARRS